MYLGPKWGRREFWCFFGHVLGHIQKSESSLAHSEADYSRIKVRNNQVKSVVSHPSRGRKKDGSAPDPMRPRGRPRGLSLKRGRRGEVEGANVPAYVIEWGRVI